MIVKMTAKLPPGASMRDRLENWSIPEPNSGCWLWLGGSTMAEYGIITIDGKARLAHRASYEEHRGPIPVGMLVLHRCDTPLCINPDHLFLGTHQDNTDDMRAKERQAAGERHGCVKITEAIVEKIAADLAAGSLSLVDISKRYSLSEQHIGNINRGRNWAHVTGASRGNPLKAKRCLS